MGVGIVSCRNSSCLVCKCSSQTDHVSFHHHDHLVMTGIVGIDEGRIYPYT